MAAIPWIRPTDWQWAHAYQAPADSQWPEPILHALVNGLSINLVSSKFPSCTFFASGGIAAASSSLDSGGIAAGASQLLRLSQGPCPRLNLPTCPVCLEQPMPGQVWLNMGCGLPSGRTERPRISCGVKYYKLEFLRWRLAVNRALPNFSRELLCSGEFMRQMDSAPLPWNMTTYSWSMMGFYTVSK